MRALILLSCLLGSSCAKHNPDVCCTTEAQCASFGLSQLYPCNAGSVCNVDGACVAPECTSASDCKSPDAPICEGQVCVSSCSADYQCAGIAGRPFCGPAGACVECKDDTSCTDSTQPICDTTSNSCRGCTGDSECASGVCLQSSGACAKDADVIWVSDGASDAGTCTKTAPCGSLQHAITQILGSRNVIKILSSTLSLQAPSLDLSFTGYIEGTNTLLTPGAGAAANATIIVDQGNITMTSLTVPPGPNLASVRVNSGQLSMFDAHLPGGGGVYGGSLSFNESYMSGFNCHSGVLVARASHFSGDAMSDTMACTIDLDGDTFTGTAAFTGKLAIRNSVFAFSMSGVLGPLLFGTGYFKFNTVVGLYGLNNNQPIGCDATIDASSNIIAFDSVNPVQCAMTHSLFDARAGLQPGTGNKTGDSSTFFVDLSTQDFHLAQGSPAIGGGEASSDVTTDFDGKPRPSPAASNPDMGAYERQN